MNEDEDQVEVTVDVTGTEQELGREFKVGEGSDFHVNISLGLTEHSYEQVSKNQNCFQQLTLS